MTVCRCRMGNFALRADYPHFLTAWRQYRRPMGGVRTTNYVCVWRMNFDARECDSVGRPSSALSKMHRVQPTAEVARGRRGFYSCPRLVFTRPETIVSLIIAHYNPPRPPLPPEPPPPPLLSYSSHQPSPPPFSSLILDFSSVSSSLSRALFSLYSFCPRVFLLFLFFLTFSSHHLPVSLSWLLFLFFVSQLFPAVFPLLFLPLVLFLLLYPSAPSPSILPSPLLLVCPFSSSFSLSFFSLFSSPSSSFSSSTSSSSYFIPLPPLILVTHALLRFDKSPIRNMLI